jgi:hypothetical protein
MSSPTAQDAEPPAGPGPQEPAASPATRPPLSRLAVAALVTGALPLAPAAVGLGIAGLAVTRGGRRRGRGLAVGGLLAAAVWLAVAAALGTVAALTHGFHRPVKVEYSYSHAAIFGMGLRPGDCISAPAGTSVSIVPCTAPHDGEVFATLTLPAGSWPGPDAVRQEANDGCAARLPGYLNPQLAVSLSQDYVYPDQVAWDGGTRTVICEVRAASGQLDQSVRGAA